MELTASSIRSALKRYTSEEGIEYGPKCVTVPHPYLCPEVFMEMAVIMGHTEEAAIRWARQHGTRIYKEGDVFRSGLLDAPDTP